MLSMLELYLHRGGKFGNSGQGGICSGPIRNSVDPDGRTGESRPVEKCKLNDSSRHLESSFFYYPRFEMVFTVNFLVLERALSAILCNVLLYSSEASTLRLGYSFFGWLTADWRENEHNIDAPPLTA